MIPISVTLLAKNCQETLEKTLRSLQDFDEVILLDTGSTDATLSLAEKFPNVRIHHSPFIGFGPLHNLATSKTTHDWVLSIDSDEVLSEELITEIRELNLNSSCVYSIERANFFNGKHIKWCGGWHPDRVVRLYNRHTTKFDDAAVHEKIIASGLQEIALQKPLYHTPYRQISDFLSKMQTYSTLFAEQNSAKKSSSIWRALFHSWHAFFKSYILKRGFLGGKEGLLISIYNGHTTFYKYLKLAEKSSKNL